MDLFADEGETPGTPDTIVLDDDIYLSPAGRARLEGDFARLIPDNSSAKVAFSDLAAVIKATPEVERPWRHLIHVNEAQETLETEMEISEVESDNEEHRLIWTGHYRFSLTNSLLPQQFSRYGWILGGGRKELKDDGVDIMLTLTKAQHRVRGRHARLALNDKSNALLLVVDPQKKVRLNGEPIQNESRVITARRTRLEIGILQYCFEYTGLSHVRYHDQLEKLRNSNVLQGTVHKALEATPTEKQIPVDNYIIHPPFAYGSYGVISACVRRTDGAPFAAKRVARTARSQSEIDFEIAMFRAVGGHPNTCELIEVLHTKSLFTESPYDEVYIIHTPLAECSFEDLSLTTHGYEVCMKALAEVIRGVEHIHRLGYTHRDIKPTNLLFCGEEGQAVVADYGQGMKQETSKDHKKGTIKYLAPEVLELKRQDALKTKETEYSKPYGNKVDVWSLGLVGFELFFRPRGGRENPDLSTEKIHQLRMKYLRESRLPVVPFLERMLSWNVESRPSMAEVASWSIWPNPPPEHITDSRKRLINATISEPEVADAE